jgi:agmatinase
LSLYCTDKRVSLEDTSFRDLGEVAANHSLEVAYRAIEDAVAAIPGATQPILLGGDHSITDPIIRGLRRRTPAKKLGLVVFDSHFDSRDPISGQEHSGHWIKTLEGVIDYGVVAQLGISAAIYSHDYMQTAETNGILVRTPYDIRRRGWQRTIDEVTEHVTRNTDAVYISVDIDAIDKAFAPGTSCVSPAGLFPHEVIDAVFELSLTMEIAGLDVVEVSPPLDALDHTSQLGAQIVLNHIAGVVARSDALHGPTP